MVGQRANASDLALRAAPAPPPPPPSPLRRFFPAFPPAMSEYFVPDAQLILRLRQIVQQKFQDQRAAKTAALDLEIKMEKPMGR